ncbi:protein argonaute-2-like [Planococcus citri]|uniref:protein argonaute-2-like n=1 Tax=Planococcus citri TaxID=170843 RepID=UPI0031F8A46B
MDDKKKNRGGGGKKSGRGGFQQQQDRDQSRPNYPPAESGNAGRGRGAWLHHQYSPRAGGPGGPSSHDPGSGASPHHQYSSRGRGSAGPSFHDPGSGGRFNPHQQQRPFVPTQPDQRFQAPAPMHRGEPPIRWGPPGGQRPSRPAFTPQRTPFPSEPSASSSTRDLPAASAWGSKSASSEAPARDPQPGGAWARKPDSDQPVAKAVAPKSASGEVHLDSKPEVAQPQPQAPEKSSEAQASSSSKSGKKKKRKGGGGIGDKPLDQAFKTDLVLGSSSQPGTKKPETKVEKAAPPAKPVQEPDKTTAPLFDIPKRPKGTLVHPAKYFQNERGSLVEVNFLRIDLKSLALKIFQYDVAFEPDKRPELFREALRLLFEQNRINRHPAHDGRKQIYVAGSKIRFPGDTDSFTGNVEVSYEEGRRINYTIAVKLTRETDLQSLATYMRNGSSLRPFDIQPLEIALMHPAMSNPDLIKAGRSFFTVPNSPTYLGNGMDLFKGHTQSVVIPWLDESKGTPHLYLNVDVAHKAFPRAQPVIDYIEHQFFSSDRGPALQNDTSLAPWQMQAASSFLKNIKVAYDDGVRRRTFKVDSLGQSPREARFKLENGRETTVLEYFRTEKNIRLKYPNLPCLNSRNRLFPIERCTVVPKQVVNKVMDGDQTSAMVSCAAKPTTERKQTINQSLRNIPFNSDPCLEEFGLTVSPNFERVNSYELKPPSIQYAGSVLSVRDGQWRQQNDKFIRPVPLLKWVLINTDDRSQNLVHNVIQEFRNAGPTCGIQVDHPQLIDIFRFRSENDFTKHFDEWKRKGAQFFMVILKDRDSNVYNYVKRAAELQIGVLTQCMKAATVKQTIRQRFGMTARNILLKLNAKINGINHVLAANLKPEILNEDVMIVGADVTHPPPGSNDLSIAAVVASHDEFAVKYNMQYRLQAPRNEMIRDLKNIMEAQLSFYQKSMGKLPKRILYYRDGVADTQFEKVLSYEVQAIRQAFAKLETRPTLTFIIVQKRHHARFFPTSQEMSDQSKNFNVRAGTVVDEKITHPTEMNFYLVSHKSIQGTARPTKYHLLYDDSSPTIDLISLERLTYYLCHLYARCNRSVSYPAPTYYAHWGAARAKALWSNDFLDFKRRGEDPCRLINEQDRRGRILDDVVNGTPMFFI